VAAIRPGTAIGGPVVPPLPRRQATQDSAIDYTKGGTVADPVDAHNPAPLFRGPERILHRRMPWEPELVELRRREALSRVAMTG